MYLIEKKTYFYLWLIVIAIIALYIQNSLFLNYDVSGGMYVANQILSGGNYNKDFFDPNPPLIFYLYMPPTIISKLFSIDYAITLPIYVLILAYISIALCYQLLKKMLHDQENISPKLITLIFCCVFLLLPLYEFGQREHLALILTMPYILCLVCQLSGKPIIVPMRVGITLLAACGYFIKPFFLITPAILEAYYICHNRKVFPLRLEVYILLCSLSIYIIAILLFYSDYIFTVIPFMMWGYYQFLPLVTKKQLAFNSLSLFCFMPILFFLFTVKQQPYKTLCLTLGLSTIGFWLSYFIQQQTWYYHILPAFSTAIILNILLFIFFIKNYNIINYKTMSLIGIGYFLFQYHLAKNMIMIIYYGSLYFYVFFFTLFYFTYYVFIIRKKITALIYALFTTFSGVIFLLLLYDYNITFLRRFYLTIIVMMIIFFCLAIGKIKTKLKYTAIAIISMLILSYPYFACMLKILDTLEIKTYINQLNKTFNLYIKNNIIFFMSDIRYLSIKHEKKIPYLQELHYLPSVFLHNKKDKHYLYYESILLNRLYDDLKKTNPGIIAFRHDFYVNKLHHVNYINHLTYLLSHKEFQQFWNKYHYKTTATITRYTMFTNKETFYIYERLK